MKNITVALHLSLGFNFESRFRRENFVSNAVLDASLSLGLYLFLEVLILIYIFENASSLAKVLNIVLQLKTSETSVVGWQRGGVGLNQGCPIPFPSPFWAGSRAG